MKLFPLHKNTITLTIVALITVGFFVAGLFDILDYPFVKLILISVSSVLVLIAAFYAFKNSDRKNRLEDRPQDDSH